MSIISTRNMTFRTSGRLLRSPTESERWRSERGTTPDIYLAWGKVILTVWTHKIDGLTESDFIFAAKAEQEFQQPSRGTGE